MSQTLYDAGINIVELETTVHNAPITGTPLFKLSARVDLPAGISPDTVREALQGIARQHNLDVEMRPHYG